MTDTGHYYFNASNTPEEVLGTARGVPPIGRYYGWHVSDSIL